MGDRHTAELLRQDRGREQLLEGARRGPLLLPLALLIVPLLRQLLQRLLG